MGTGTVCKVQKVFGRINQHHGFNKKKVYNITTPFLKELGWIFSPKNG